MNKVSQGISDFSGIKSLFVILVFLLPWFSFNNSSAQEEVLIPASPVVLGNYPEGYGNYPPEVVHLPDYYINKNEVTNQAFARFVEEGGYRKMEYWIIPGGKDSLSGWQWKESLSIVCPKFWDLSDQPYWKNDPYSFQKTTPVIGVSWFEAYAYAQWANKRLPTAAELEKAARGNSDLFGKYKEVGVGFKYPWGNNFFRGQKPPEFKLSNWRLRYYGYRYPDTNGRASATGYPVKTWHTDGYRESVAPVGSFSPQGDSPYGACDMAGNVWEWTTTAYPKFENKLLVIKGGGWYKSTLEHLKSGYNYGIGPFIRSKYIGFRCASDRQ